MVDKVNEDNIKEIAKEFQKVFIFYERNGQSGIMGEGFSRIEIIGMCEIIKSKYIEDFFSEDEGFHSDYSDNYGYV